MADDLRRRQFQQLAVELQNIPQLLAVAGNSERARRQILRLAERCSGSRSLSAHATISAALEQEPAEGVVTAVSEWILSLVDTELQQEYQRILTCVDGTVGDWQEAGSASHLKRASMELVRYYDWSWLSGWLGVSRDDLLRRLSNFAFQCIRVNFRFTHHCNITCQHCYNESGPLRAGLRLSVAEMCAVITQMPSVGIPALNLTGGEPFLYQTDLLEIIRACRTAGLEEISLYTNGFWATDRSAADTILGRLEQEGFMLKPDDHIKVSTGSYHEPFIPFDRVVHLAEAYWSRFGRRLVVDVEVASDAPADRARFAQLILNAGIGDRIALQQRRVARIGRGAALTPAVGDVDRPCPSINQIVVDPDGKVRPCCGFNSENDGIVIGDLRRHSLRQLVKAMQNDPVLQLLATRSMSEIPEATGRTATSADHSHICELCSDVLGTCVGAARTALENRLRRHQKLYPFWFAEEL